MGRFPLIVSYILILLKAHSTLHLNTHTHTSIHLSIQHNISSQDLTFIYHSHQPTLAYIYCTWHPFYPSQKHVYIKSRQKRRHQTNHIIIQSMAYRLAYTCSSKKDKALITNKCMFMVSKQEMKRKP